MFAYIVIYGSPLVAAALFYAFPKPLALTVTIIVGYLFLPPIIINLPGLPPLDKNTIPALLAFVAVLLMGTKKDTFCRPGWIPQGTLPRLLLLSFFASTLLTVATNREPVVLTALVLPGLKPWDAVSMIAAIVLTLLPLLLGRKLLAFPTEQRLLLAVLAIAGVVYSLLVLYEFRMSPQLNRIIYGFVAHSWGASFRGDSFRPVVFFVNGLLVSMFLSTAILAACSLTQVSAKIFRLVYLWVGIWLFLTLVLTKSLGALVITVVLIPAILFLSRRSQILVAAILSGIVLLYPMLRGADLVPVDRILEWSESISAERAYSLNYRLVNEDVLLDRARQKPLFGWGGWGRNHLFNDEGQLATTTDGWWVGSIGVGGWGRYLPEFGLLCFPAIIALFRRKKYDLGPETVLLLLILAGNLVDLLPNASLSAVSWLIVGSIWGKLEIGETILDAPPTSAQEGRTGRLVYARSAKDRTTHDVVTQDPTAQSDNTQHRYSRQKARVDRSASKQADRSPIPKTSRQARGQGDAEKAGFSRNSGPRRPDRSHD